MTDNPFTTASADVVCEALAHKLTNAGLPDGADLARAMIEGFFAGQDAMKAYRNESQGDQPFFDYENAMYHYRYHFNPTETLCENLPGLIDELHLNMDADRARSLIAENKDDAAAALDRIIKESDEGYEGVCAALINHQKEQAAKMLVEPNRSGRYSSGDMAAGSLSRAADYLIGGVKSGVICENEISQHAYALGQTMGAGGEALYQAANAFDDEAYREAGETPDTSGWKFIASLLAVVPSILVMCESPVGFATVESSALAEVLFEVALPLGTYLLVCVILFAIIDLCARPRLETRENLIAEEAANRTRMVVTNQLPPMEWEEKAETDDMNEDETELDD